jgi:hypothetical protein
MSAHDDHHGDTLGGSTSLELDTLAESLPGVLARRDGANWDENRSVYNGMIDRQPAAIAQCRDVADVIACVNIARAAGVDLAV